MVATFTVSNLVVGPAISGNGSDEPPAVEPAGSQDAPSPPSAPASGHEEHH